MTEFKNLSTIEEIDAFIQKNQLSFIHISRPDCSVCHGLLPQVRKLMENYPQIKLGHINVDEIMEVTEKLSVFTVPVLLLFVEGKEYIREARIVHLDLLKAKIHTIYQNVVGE